MSSKNLRKYERVVLPRWFYLGGETLTMDGTEQFLTIPSTAEIIQLEIETAAVYYEINGSAHNADAPGYIAADSARIIGPLARLDSLAVWGTAADAGVVHVMYFVEM